MSPFIPTNELADEFINALQISIDSEIANFEIVDSIYIPGHSLNIIFKLPFKQIVKDHALKRFIELTEAKWTSEGLLTIPAISDDYITLLKDFLLLTRLKPENMAALIKMDSRFRKLAPNKQGAPEKLQGSSVIETVFQASQGIFGKMKDGPLTIRELAEKTGLSMVAISNFKAGKDIRLSNFLKIAEALGLKMKLE